MLRRDRVGLIKWMPELLDGKRLTPHTQEKINYVQQTLNIKLPSSYINLLMIQNGGCVIANKIELENIEQYSEFFQEGDYLQLDSLLGISTNLNEGILLNVELENQDYFEIPKKLVLFANSELSGFFFDYREYEGQNPPIIFKDLTLECEIPISETFDEFLNKVIYLNLNIQEEWEIIIGKKFSKQDVEQAIKQKKKYLKIDNQKFNITFFLEYFANEECDFDWLLDLLEKITAYSDFMILSGAEIALSHRIMRLKKNEINDEKAKRVISQFKDHPKDNDNKDLSKSATILIEEINKIKLS